MIVTQNTANDQTGMGDVVSAQTQQQTLNQQHNIPNPQLQNLQQQQAQQQQIRQRQHLSAVKLKFPDLVSTMYLDNIRFCQLINGVLAPVFSNYHGSKIEIVQNRQLYASIFFIDNGKQPLANQYLGIEKLIDKNNFATSDDRIGAINRYMNISVAGRKFYKLSDIAKELLQDIIHPQFINRNNGKVDWDKIVREGSYQVQGGQSVIYVQVIIDLIKILKVIYGSKSDDGGNWTYQIVVGNPINPINSPAGQISNKWQLFVMRTNSKDVNDIAMQYGYNWGGNDMGIITNI